MSTTALPGMLQDVEVGTRRAAAHLLSAEPSATVTGIELAPLGALHFERTPQPSSTWRYRMSDMLDELAKTGSGLLITVDELDPNLDEMIELAAVYQHFVQEGRKVALLMAGLPHNVSSLINNKTVSFLRRAQQERLGRIADYDVRAAFLRTVTEYGRTIDLAGLDLAVDEIGGFAFLMQLIGFRAWDINPSGKNITIDDVAAGVSIARAEMEDRVLDATFRKLSPEDIRFLEAMLQDEEESLISNLRERLDRSSAQIAQYRRRLIDAGIIGEKRRGVVAFELPYFRAYLEHRL